MHKCELNELKMLFRWYWNKHVYFKKEFLRLCQDFCFDKLYKINTMGNYIKYCSNINEDITIYLPTGYKNIQNILNSIKLRNQDIFVDFGCGKGRTVFLASLRKIKKAVGIEYNHELFKDALKNKKKFKFNKSEIKILYLDAAKYKITDETIFFFFNPFGLKTLNKILNNIKKSLKYNPRKIYIIYHADRGVYSFLKTKKWLIEEKSMVERTSIWRNKFFVK